MRKQLFLRTFINLETSTVDMADPEPVDIPSHMTVQLVSGSRPVYAHVMQLNVERTKRA